MNAPEKPPFNLRTVYWVLLLGLGVSFYLIYSTIRFDELKPITVSAQLLTGLLLAGVTVIVRDAAYVYRIRVITGKKLSWFSSLQLVMLWEYGSAATPATTGGVALAMLAFKQDGISVGKSTSIILFCKFLDDVSFVLVFGVLYALIGPAIFLVEGNCADLEGHPVLQTVRELGNKAWIGIVVLLLVSAFLAFLVFVVPKQAQNFLHRLANKKWLHRFSSGIKTFADDVVLASKEFKQKPWLFHLQLLAATTVSWMARYALANAVIYAFASNELQQLVVFARQYLLWVFLMIPSTPGASGWAEVSFMAMNCEFITTGYSPVVVLIWRAFNHYLYLLIGIFMLRELLLRIRRNSG